MRENIFRGNMHFIKSKEGVIIAQTEESFDYTSDLEEIEAEIKKGVYHLLIIDMQLTNFIDSSGLGKLLQLKNISIEDSLDLKLINVTPLVFYILKDASLVKQFEIETLNE